MTHRACGRLAGDADVPTLEGYRIWIVCACGARFERTVTLKEANKDLVYSDRLVSRS